MSKYKNTGIIYIHIGMNEWVKRYSWEFPHKTKKEENKKNVTHKELERLSGVLWVRKVGLIWPVIAMAVTWKPYCLFLPSSIMSQSVLCNCFKVCMKFLLERERVESELLKNKKTLSWITVTKQLKIVGTFDLIRLHGFHLNDYYKLESCGKI